MCVGDESHVDMCVSSEMIGKKKRKEEKNRVDRQIDK